MSKVAAFHEAGHVVATILCGEQVYSARVADGTPFEDRRGREVQALGFCETSLNAQPPELLTLQLEGAPDLVVPFRRRAIAVAFADGAGAAAEARASRKSLVAVWFASPAQGDLQSSMMALKPFVANEQRRRKTVFRIWERSARIISRGAAWRAVEAVAGAMMGGAVGGDELDAVARGLLRDAARSPVWLSRARNAPAGKGANRSRCS